MLEILSPAKASMFYCIRTTAQLQVETYVCALSPVYTFRPTFREEHLHTSRHLVEFWMVEPEVAFTDIQ
ncbi:UNVERIFIED_CONTAM: Asparagine--tRNA ligase, cytoplasmic 3, partial [Sesamum radiatum]